MNFDAITIGDYSLDIILEISENKEQVKVEPLNNSLILSREDKILVDGFYSAIGGNACNVAVGLARLGLNTSYATFYGNEWWYENFLSEMQSNKVDLSLTKKISQKAANYSTSLFFKNEKTMLVHNSVNAYALDKEFPLPKILYVSSIGPTYESFFEELSDFVYRHKTILAFNPASHQFTKTLSSYRNLLAVTEFLFVNKKEAQKILTTDEKSVSKLLSQLAELGVKSIILTDQTNGAYLYFEEKTYFCPIFPLPVKQKTGAGDAFASGFLAGFFYQESPIDALRWGTFNSGSVVSKNGPHDGLLYKEEIEKFLNDNQTPKVEQVLL